MSITKLDARAGATGSLSHTRHGPRLDARLLQVTRLDTRYYSSSGRRRRKGAFAPRRESPALVGYLYTYLIGFPKQRSIGQATQTQRCATTTHEPLLGAKNTFAGPISQPFSRYGRSNEPPRSTRCTELIERAREVISMLPSPTRAQG